MRYAIAIISLLVEMGGLAGQTDLRAVTWGMSQEAVARVETGRLVEMEGDTVLTYYVGMLGMAGYIHYHFIDGKLAEAQYDLARPMAFIAMDYEADFDRFVRLWRKRYGEPFQQIDVSSVHFYRTYPEFNDIGIYHGHVTPIARWSTARTRIYSVMRGDDKTCLLHLNIIYYHQDALHRHPDRLMWW